MKITTKINHPSVFVNKTFTVNPEKYGISSVDITFQIILVKNNNNDWVFEEIELIDVFNIQLEGKESVLNTEEQKVFTSLLNFEDEICEKIEGEIKSKTPSDYVNEFFPSTTTSSIMSREDLERFIDRLNDIKLSVVRLDVDESNIEFYLDGREVCVSGEVEIDGKDDVEENIDELVDDMENFLIFPELKNNEVRVV